ncbi:MAG: endo-1,3-alpha-glucanase family glycosylhydrolase [Capsulimonadaceae bacterium]|nr:endo-1,3-alpha-glucanase family glycosylhydrolase [Capsulimonadaceae bacterium]
MTNPTSHFPILHLFTIVLLLAHCTAVCECASSSPERPIVYAHYMHCYVLGGMADRVANDEPPYRDVAVAPDLWPEAEDKDRTWWSARLAPLAKGGLPAVREDFELGERAGLDAFGFLMGARSFIDQFSPGLRLAAQVAQTSKVKLLPDMWTDFAGLDDNGERDLGVQVKAFMDKYPGAFLQRDGRYVISLGCPMGYGRTHGNFVEWDRVKPFFDAWKGPQGVYIILNTTWNSDDLATGWGNAPNAFGLWTAPHGWHETHGSPDLLISYAARYGKEISWPVHSTYYGGRKGCESMAEDLGVSGFCDLWRGAIAHHAAMAEVQTWNDFSEDHAITETNYRGDTMITLNRYFSDWYHNGAPPAITVERVFLFHHRQLVNARLTQATILAHNDQWHNTPTVDYLNVVTMLRHPADVSLTDGEHTWTSKAPAGLHEWLVYVPSVRTRAAPDCVAYDHGDGAAYPRNNSARTVTVASALSAGIPSATVSRGGHQVASVRSRLPLSEDARWQDLAMVGDMAPDK